MIEHLFKTEMCMGQLTEMVRAARTLKRKFTIVSPSVIIPHRRADLRKEFPDLDVEILSPQACLLRGLPKTGLILVDELGYVDPNGKFMQLLAKHTQPVWVRSWWGVEPLRPGVGVGPGGSALVAERWGQQAEMLRKQNERFFQMSRYH